MRKYAFAFGLIVLVAALILILVHLNDVKENFFAKKTTPAATGPPAKKGKEDKAGKAGKAETAKPGKSGAPNLSAATNAKNKSKGESTPLTKAVQDKAAKTGSGSNQLNVAPSSIEETTGEVSDTLSGAGAATALLKLQAGAPTASISDEMSAEASDDSAPDDAAYEDAGNDDAAYEDEEYDE